MFKSLRSRITAAATVVVALTLLLASVVIVRMVEADLIDATERALAAELELEAEAFELNESFFEFEVLNQSLALGVFLEDDGVALGSIFEPLTNAPVAEVVIDTATIEVIELFDPFSGQLIDDPPLAAAIEALNFDFRDVDGEDGNLLLVGAVARDEVDESLAAVRQALLITVPLFTLLMGLLIWWLVGRALRPVRAMSDRVDAITTSSLDQRVPVPPGNDEISGLANVMNNMLSRLQRGDSRQRQFAADASHELRSPLSTVRAAAEMIERNPTSDRAPRLAADIVSEADRMDQLIGDLLSLSRVDDEQAATAHQPVDLTALAAAFGTDTNLGQIEPGITVLGDEQQLKRAIKNLLSNARRHANDKIALTVSSVECHDNSHAQVCVEDDGDGVPPELRQTIFERFSRLDEARSRDQGGAGIGLSLVQAIVQRHRGSIAVDDSPTLGGARFTIHLPLM